MHNSPLVTALMAQVRTLRLVVQTGKLKCRTSGIEAINPNGIRW